MLNRAPFSTRHWTCIASPRIRRPPRLPLKSMSDFSCSQNGSWRPGQADRWNRPRRASATQLRRTVHRGPLQPTRSKAPSSRRVGTQMPPTTLTTCNRWFSGRSTLYSIPRRLATLLAMPSGRRESTALLQTSLARGHCPRVTRLLHGDRVLGRQFGFDNTVAEQIFAYTGWLSHTLSKEKVLPVPEAARCLCGGGRAAENCHRS